jgi:hypothetical protein
MREQLQVLLPSPRTDPHLTRIKNVAMKKIKKTAMLKCRLDQETNDSLKSKAEELNISMSEVVRWCIANSSYIAKL